MADLNPFDLLGDDDAEDPTQLVAKVAPAKKAEAPTAQKQQQPAKLPSRPLPPPEAVREAKTEPGRGGRGGGRGRGRGRGGAGFDKENTNNGSTFGSREFSGGIAPPEEADSGKPSERHGGYGGPRGPFRGGRRGGFGDGDTADGERPRRVFDRRSRTGRGSELKREGSGRGNWGTQTDELAVMTEEVNEVEKTQNVEKPSREEEETDANKEPPSTEAEEKEPEDKEMTLEEYEKVLEEKRKALQARKTEERKVDAREFESMQQISKKKNTDDIFIKLGSEKDKRKESSEKEEKAKKSVSINEFLKPAEGERYYASGGRGRGRGRGRGYRGGDAMNNMDAPSIEDPGQFPTLGGK